MSCTRCIPRCRSPFGFGFRDPCDKHDECYQTCGSDKAACDEAFRQSLLRVCGSNPSCRGLANTYYNMVRDYGQSSYDGDQLYWCQCCP